MNNITLKPCPYCNSTTASIKKLRKGFYIQCDLSSPRGWLHKDERCEVQNVVTGIYPSPELAIEQWNWRLDAN
jgi:hypothetical protein